MRPEHAQRPGVFETFRGFVDLLQRKLEISQRAVVIDELPHSPLAVVDFDENLEEVGHRPVALT